MQHVFRGDVTGEHDHRQRAQRGVLAQLVQQIEAADPGQPHIEEYQIGRRQFLQFGDDGLGIGCRAHVIAVQAEFPRQDAHQRHVVVDAQDGTLRSGRERRDIGRRAHDVDVIAGLLKLDGSRRDFLLLSFRTRCKRRRGFGRPVECVGEVQVVRIRRRVHVQLPFARLGVVFENGVPA